jgi:hypothetical protein
LGVEHVGLAAGDLLDVAGADQHQLEALLEHRPGRLPVHAAGLHQDRLDVVRFQPIGQRQQAADRGRELLNEFLQPPVMPDPPTRRDAGLVHIQRPGALHDPLHHILLIGIDKRRPQEPRIN